MEQVEYRDFFSTLANHSRLAIVQLLRRHGATVTQIAESLGYEQSRVSHSLARLQQAGIVACRWEDKRKVFRLAEDLPTLLRDIDLYLERHPKAGRNGTHAERSWSTHWATAASE